MNKLTKKTIEIAEFFIGIKENPKNSNRGIYIDIIQKAFGFQGVQYCVLFVLYCYKRAFEMIGLTYPFFKTASSQTLFHDAKKEGLVYTDPQLIKPGDIVIWRKWKLWQGHAGLIISYLENDMSFRTIEGNTKSEDLGEQREGDGIYRKIRYAKKIDFSEDGFYLRGFIDMQKATEKYDIHFVNAKPLEKIEFVGKKLNDR